MALIFMQYILEFQREVIYGSAGWQPMCLCENLAAYSRNMETALRVHFRGFGNTNLHMDQRRACYHSQTIFTDVPGRTADERRRERDHNRIIDGDWDVMNEMFAWVQSHPGPGFVVLFSSDMDYTYSMLALSNLGLTTFVCYDPKIIDARSFLSQNVDYHFNVWNVIRYATFWGGRERFGNYVEQLLVIYNIQAFHVDHDHSFIKTESSGI